MRLQACWAWDLFCIHGIPMDLLENHPFTMQCRHLSSRKLTYPTLGKGTSSSKSALLEDKLSVPLEGTHFMVSPRFPHHLHKLVMPLNAGQPCVAFCYTISSCGARLHLRIGHTILWSSLQLGWRCLELRKTNHFGWNMVKLRTCQLDPKREELVLEGKILRTLISGPWLKWRGQEVREDPCENLGVNCRLWKRLLTLPSMKRP